jgi:hypothetical protein
MLSCSASIGLGATTLLQAPIPILVDPVTSKYREMGGANGSLGAAVHEVRTAPDGRGRFQAYAGGSIYWSSATGAHVVRGAIRDKWAQLGWERSFLGYPVADETATPDGVGRFNHFQGASIYWTPATGAREIHGAIRDRWASMGWETSLLGYPISDELDLTSGSGRVSRLQGGRIEWYRATGQIAVFDAGGRRLDRTRLHLIKLVCHDTEDSGEDEIRLTLDLDGRRVQAWRREINEDDSNPIAVSELSIDRWFDFQSTAHLELWDEDWPDADDRLGVVAIVPQANRFGRASFREDGSSYTLIYEVDGPAAAIVRPAVRASSIVEAFRNGIGGGVFTHADLASRADVASSIDSRLADLGGLQQLHTPLCGPAAVVYEVLRRRPDLYAQWAVELWQTGSITLKGERHSISAGLRRSAIQGGMSRADWIVLASLRDIENWVFDLQAGDVDDWANVDGITGPWAMKGWIETLLCGWGTNMETSLVYGEYDDLELAGRYVANGGVAFINVNVDALRKHDGGNLPDHWMALTAAPRIDRQTGCVELEAWTYGEPPKWYRLNRDQFEDAFYGVVVGMVPDPLIDGGSSARFFAPHSGAAERLPAGK